MMQRYLENPQELWMLLVQGSLFALVVALWLGGVIIWYMRRSKRDRELATRLGVWEDGQGERRVLRLWHGSQVRETVVPELARQSLLERLDLVRQSAGWTSPMPLILLMLVITMALALVLSMVLLKNPLLGVAAGGVMALGFRGYLGRCISRRTELLEKQLVDALDLGARSLRAGHPLSGAFRLISEEIDAPVGSMFAEIVDQESLGVSVQEALRQAADRARSSDMRVFAASVIIQLRSGGNLADMMERVTWVIRERMRLSRRARVLTAEAQFSKWILLALPLGLFVLLSVMRPQYMELFFTHQWGQLMVIGGLVSMVIGGWLMGRMARLDY